MLFWMCLQLIQVVVWVKQYIFSGMFWVVGCNWWIMQVMCGWMFGWFCRQVRVQVWNVLMLVSWWWLVVSGVILLLVVFYFCNLVCLWVMYLVSRCIWFRCCFFFLLRKCIWLELMQIVCLICCLLDCCMLCQFLNDFDIRCQVGIEMMVLLKFCIFMVYRVMFIMLLLVLICGILIQLLICSMLLLVSCMLVMKDIRVFLQISRRIVDIVLRLDSSRSGEWLMMIEMMMIVLNMNMVIFVSCMQFLIEWVWVCLVCVQMFSRVFSSVVRVRIRNSMVKVSVRLLRKCVVLFGIFGIYGRLNCISSEGVVCVRCWNILLWIRLLSQCSVGWWVSRLVVQRMMQWVIWLRIRVFISSRLKVRLVCRIGCWLSVDQYLESWLRRDVEFMDR